MSHVCVWIGGSLTLLFACLRIKAAPLSVMVPAYFYPTENGPWNELNRAAARVPLVAIMNPSNGPGLGTIADYTRAVNALRAAGGRVIGYVFSSYAARPTNAVITDIERYLAWYDIDGFFIDEMTNDTLPEHLAYYRTLFATIQSRRPGAFVVANPGTHTAEAYLRENTADTLTIFESNTGFENYTPAAWTTNYGPNRFFFLPYNITNATAMTNAVNLAVARRGGHVYVTDDAGVNPWDRLPTYWEAEINLIQAINSTRLKMLRRAASPPAIHLEGAPGSYVLEGSGHFQTWIPLQTNFASNGAVTFVDSSAPATGPRFYRTRRQ